MLMLRDDMARDVWHSQKTTTSGLGQSMMKNIRATQCHTLTYFKLGRTRLRKILHAGPGK